MSYQSTPTDRETDRERDAGGITAVLITDPWAMTY